MDVSTVLTATLGSYLILLPIFLVWLTGIILALVFWRRHPRVSLLTVIALVIFLVESLVNTALNMWLPLMLSERHIATSQIGLILGIRGIVTSILLAVPWGLLIAAIFIGRKAVTIKNQSTVQESPIAESSSEDDK